MSPLLADVAMAGSSALLGALAEAGNGEREGPDEARGLVRVILAQAGVTRASWQLMVARLEGRGVPGQMARPMLEGALRLAGLTLDLLKTGLALTEQYEEPPGDDESALQAVVEEMERMSAQASRWRADLHRPAPAIDWEAVERENAAAYARGESDEDVEVIIQRLKAGGDV